MSIDLFREFQSLAHAKLKQIRQVHTFDQLNGLQGEPPSARKPRLISTARTVMMSGADLKAWRRAIGWTQSDLMEELGITSRQTIAGWERAARLPRLVELAVITKHVETEVVSKTNSRPFPSPTRISRYTKNLPQSRKMSSQPWLPTAIAVFASGKAKGDLHMQKDREAKKQAARKKQLRRIRLRRAARQKRDADIAFVLAETMI